MPAESKIPREMSGLSLTPKFYFSTRDDFLIIVDFHFRDDSNDCIKTFAFTQRVAYKDLPNTSFAFCCAPRKLL